MKLKQHTFRGKMNDGTEVAASVHDLSDFVNVSPDSEIFVSVVDDETSETALAVVRKADVTWTAIEGIWE